MPVEHEQLPQRVADPLVILDQQDPHWFEWRVGSSNIAFLGRFGSFLKRQHQAKAAAGAQSAFDGQIALVAAGNTARDGQPQAGATLSFGGVERLKDTFAYLGWDALTRIANL